MNEVSEFGNTGWQVFVFGAYAAVIAALAIYTLFALRSRATAMRALKDEGYLSDLGKGTD